MARLAESIHGYHSSMAVVCRGVTKIFGCGGTQVMALRGVDADIPFGGMTILVGPSGCGKTTLLSIIAGHLGVTAGWLEVLGTVSTATSDPRAMPAPNIGFVFQHYHLIPALTAVENVAVPLIIAGEDRHASLASAGLLLERMDLSHRSAAYPAQLSGGQQQRVSVARALIADPQLIICDEPTAALDAKTGRSIMSLLRERALASNRAVLVVTHDERVLEFGDRIIHLQDGRVHHVDSCTVT